MYQSLTMRRMVSYNQMAEFHTVLVSRTNAKKIVHYMSRTESVLITH